MTLFSPSVLDQAKVNFYSSYLHSNYYDQIREDQGLREIIKILREYGAGPKWLDVGAGPLTLFWSIPLKNIDSVYVNDLHPEALYVSNKFKKNDDIPKCYSELLTLCDKTQIHCRKLMWNWHVFDALSHWPTFTKGKFDLITQMGCFGLAKDRGNFVDSVGQALRSLKEGGCLIGANWKRSSKLVSKNGIDNSFLSQNLIDEAAKVHKSHLKVCKIVPIVGDPSYDFVIIWVISNMEKL